jgi:cardiolipin synthase
VPPGEDRVLTVPNLFSLGRLLCVPIFLWLLFGPDPPHRVAAAWLLAGLGATDWVDGWVARRFHQESALGKVLDPTADRVLLLVGVVAILVDGAVPVWVGVAALVREALVAVAALVLAAAGVRRIDVTWWGKAGTFALMFAFPFFLASHAPDLWWHDAARVLAWCFALPGLALSWYAAALYVPVARHELRKRRVGSSP